MTSWHATPSLRNRTNRRRKYQSLFDALEGRALFAATVGTVDFGAAKQTVEGLGASPIMWAQPPEHNGTALYDTLVNDLGVSGARTPIWADFETENDNNDPNTFDWSKFDSSALAPAMSFLQRLKERGATEFFGTVWSPPYWMKTNHAISGGGSLRYDMRDEFAEFCAATVIAAQRDFGIHLDGLSIQNEQFFVESYESGVMDAQEMREIVIAVQKKFAKEGLTTKVIANEDLGDQDSSRWAWFNQPMLDDDEVDKSKLIVGAHYTAAQAMAKQANQLAGTGVPLWYTEVSGKQPDWTSGLQTAGELSDIFNKAGASAYYYYFFDTSPSLAYETPPHVGTASLMSDGVPNGKYYGLKHFYKYVRPGMQRVATSIDETSGTRLSAFKDPKTGASTIVLMNISSTATDYTLNLSNLGKNASYDVYQSTQDSYWNNLGKLTGNGSVSLSLPGYSIVTLHDGPEIAPVSGNPGSTMTNGPLKDMTSGYDAGGSLRRAAYNGDLSTLQQWLSWVPGAVNAADAHGWTPLHAVAASVYWKYGASDQLGVMKALIAAGADVNAKTDDGFTPLHVMAMNQFIEWGASSTLKADMATLLVNAGADVNAVDNAGRTALHWAALTPASTDENHYNNNVPLRLLSLGADRTLRDAAGRTAYDYAVQEYKAPFATILNGTNVDTVAPTARLAKYLPDKNQITLVLNEDVTASFSASDVQLVNRATNAVVTGWTMATPTFSSGLTLARLNLNTRLPDGKYRMTIPAGTFSDQSGTASTTDITVDFTILRGDANNDGLVNFDDLLVLARNYTSGAASANTTGTTGAMLWSQGDFNGDGVVNFDDLLLLAKNYGKSV